MENKEFLFPRKTLESEIKTDFFVSFVCARGQKISLKLFTEALWDFRANYLDNFKIFRAQIRNLIALFV